MPLPDRVRRRRRVIVAAGVVLLAAIAAIAVLARDGDPATPLTITWDESEGRPACRYHPENHTVTARLKVEGKAARAGEKTVTVSAYADENTSIPVGSNSRSVRVEGTMHTSVVVTIPVEKPPHIGEDDVTACKLAVR